MSAGGISACLTVHAARSVTDVADPRVVLIQTDQQMRAAYEQTVRDWRGCEAIVRQREREKHAEALARCSSGASVERGPVQRDSTISTDASLTVKLMQPFWLYRGGISKEILMFTDICFFLPSLSLFSSAAVIAKQQLRTTEY